MKRALPTLAERATRFLSRHRLSISLSALSAACFARLAQNLRGEGLGALDRAAMSWVFRARGRLDTPMLWLTRLGSFDSLLAIVCLSFALLLWRRKRRRTTFVGVAGAGTLLLLLALKAVFRRDRPDAADLYLLHTPSSFSFPSGHALGTTGVLLLLVVVARVSHLRGVGFGAVLGVAVALILGVALSRVYFGVHFPSDVVGGILAGAGWIAAVTGYFFPRALPGEHRARAGKQRLADVESGPGGGE